MADNSATVPANETSANQDVPQLVDLDFGVAIERIDSWLDGGIRLLPNVLVALVLLLVFYGLALLVRRFILRQTHTRGRDNLGEVLGTLLNGPLCYSAFCWPPP